MLIKRFAQNPLITPADVPPSRSDYEVVGAFNAGATIHQGKVLLLLRVAERPKDISSDEQVAPIFDPQTSTIELFRVKNTDPDVEIIDSRSFFYKGRMYLTSISHLRLARSDDGCNFTIDPTPAVFPQTKYETFGIEDPRITKIGELYYITYKVVSGHGIATALLTTTDFKAFERKGIIFCPENIDVAILPEKINGKFYALTRPVPTHIGPRAIWIASSSDAINWGDHQVLIAPKPDTFTAGKVGASCVPIKTPDGWLEIYHASDDNDRYSLAACLLDANDPSKVIADARQPLAQSEADYETQGFYSNVVFSCGAVQRGEAITIYYGAADQCTAAANTTIKKILSTMA